MEIHFFVLFLVYPNASCSYLIYEWNGSLAIISIYACSGDADHNLLHINRAQAILVLMSA